jgi:MSHA biogenesis protein MshJ
MKSWWKKTAAHFDALQTREQCLVAVALIGGIVAFAYSLFIEPHLERARLSERNIVETRALLNEAQAQKALLGAPDQHPDVAARSELEDLKAKLDSLSGRLNVLERALVPPNRVMALLEEMVGVKNALRLISLKTLPATPFMGESPDKTGKAGGKNAGLYRHGVEVRLEGSYQDLCAYLERLEKSPIKLLWGSAVLQAENHPRLVLTLTVYSLSMDRTWLIV